MQGFSRVPTHFPPHISIMEKRILSPQVWMVRDATSQKGEAILPLCSAQKVTGSDRGRRDQQQSWAQNSGSSWQQSSKPTLFLHKITNIFLSVGPALPIGYVSLGGPSLPGDLPNCQITHPLREPVISLCNSAVFCSKRPCVVWQRGFGRGWPVPTSFTIPNPPAPDVAFEHGPWPWLGPAPETE